jgi:hypothetical protein
MKADKITILRLVTQPQTRGVMLVSHDKGNAGIAGDLPVFACVTLELPWKNNERRVSCIPTGVYRWVKIVSPKFKECIHITSVVGRSEILIHPANRKEDLLGCIGVGVIYGDVDKDGEEDDITTSRATMDILMSVTADSGTLHVIEQN